MKKKATLKETVSEAAAEAAKAVEPTVNAVIEKAKPIVTEAAADAAKVLDEATQAAEPVMEAAAEKAAPVVEKVKEAAKKAAPKAKKATAAVKKAVTAIVPEVFVQIDGREFVCTDLIERCKDDYRSTHSGIITSCKIYVKPVDAVAYYVINDEPGHIKL